MLLGVTGIVSLGEQTSAAAQNQNPCVTGVGGSSAFSPNCLVFNSNRKADGSTGNFEIWTMQVNPSAAPSTLRPFTSDSIYDSWFARISPDRTKILFHRLPQGLYADSGNNLDKVTVWVMNADGSAPTLVPKPTGWGAYGHAEWIQRDGRMQLLMAGYQDASLWRIYTLDYLTPGAAPVQVSDHYGIDPSWSSRDPDNFLYVSCVNPSPGCAPTSQELYRGPQSLATLASRSRLSTNSATDHDPYLSNAGGQVAWIQHIPSTDNFSLGRWNIWVMNRTGSHARNLTKDTEINSVPQYARWSPNDTWIYFHRLRVPQDSAWGIYRITPGGGGGSRAMQPVLVDGFSNEHPSL